MSVSELSLFIVFKEFSIQTLPFNVLSLPASEGISAFKVLCNAQCLLFTVEKRFCGGIYGHYQKLELKALDFKKFRQLVLRVFFFGCFCFGDKFSCILDWLQTACVGPDDLDLLIFLLLLPPQCGDCCPTMPCLCSAEAWTPAFMRTRQNALPLSFMPSPDLDFLYLGYLGKHM